MLPTTIALQRLSAACQTGSKPSFRLMRNIHRSHGTMRQQSNPPNPVSHGAESYFVDEDDILPPDASIFKVDATSDVAQSAYDPPTGPWSRAGARTEEHRAVSKDTPYDLPSGPNLKLRYGGTRGLMEDKVDKTRKAREGPRGSQRRGRKPEGRA